MARIVSVCRFSDGSHKFLVYCTTAGSAFSPLFHTADAASLWLDCSDWSQDDATDEEICAEEAVSVWSFAQHLIGHPELLNEDDAWSTYANRSSMKITGRHQEHSDFGHCSCYEKCSTCLAEEQRSEAACARANENANRPRLFADFTVYSCADVLAARAADDKGSANARQQELARALREALEPTNAPDSRYREGDAPAALVSNSLHASSDNDFVFCCQEDIAETSDPATTSRYCKAFLICGPKGGSAVALSVARGAEQDFGGFDAFCRKAPALARDANSEVSLLSLAPFNRELRLPRDEAWQAPPKRTAEILLRAAYLDESAFARKEAEALSVVVAKAAARAPAAIEGSPRRL